MADNNKSEAKEDGEETAKPVVSSIFPDRNDCTYTKCYCEENVWKLCEYIRNHRPELVTSCYAVFISNSNKQVPLWMQSSSKREDRLVIWDYHVIFLHQEDDNQTWVYDLDSELPFPCDFVDYVLKGLRDDRRMKEEFKRNFRVTQADEFLQTFASDRSHMLSEEGEYLMPPPPYSFIHTQASFNNIQYFISMNPDEGFGDVMNSVEFIRTFSPTVTAQN